MKRWRTDGAAGRYLVRRWRILLAAGRLHAGAGRAETPPIRANLLTRDA